MIIQDAMSEKQRIRLEDKKRKGAILIKEEKERVVWANITTFSLNMGVVIDLEESMLRS